MRLFVWVQISLTLLFSAPLFAQSHQSANGAYNPIQVTNGDVTVVYMISSAVNLQNKVTASKIDITAMSARQQLDTLKKALFPYLEAQYFHNRQILAKLATLEDRQREIQDSITLVQNDLAVILTSLRYDILPSLEQLQSMHMVVVTTQITTQHIANSVDRLTEKVFSKANHKQQRQNSRVERFNRYLKNKTLNLMAVELSYGTSFLTVLGPFGTLRFRPGTTLTGSFLFAPGYQSIGGIHGFLGAHLAYMRYQRDVETITASIASLGFDIEPRLFYRKHSGVGNYFFIPIGMQFGTPLHYRYQNHTKGMTNYALHEEGSETDKDRLSKLQSLLSAGVRYNIITPKRDFSIILSAAYHTSDLFSQDYKDARGNTPFSNTLSRFADFSLSFRYALF